VRLFRFIAKLHLYVLAAALRLVPNPYAWWALRQSFADPSKLDPEAARRVFWDTKVTDPRGRREFEQHLAALDNTESVVIAPDLQKINVPTLLLWGRADTYLPWNTVGERLRTLMPGADVQLIEGAGHVPHLETPTAYVDALLRWRRACRP
jgi:pimeloyl-ACP methyl ester carboxylesterase